MQAMLAAGAAPAIVKVANLMPVFSRPEIVLPTLGETFVVTRVSGNTLMTFSAITREALRILNGQTCHWSVVGDGISDQIVVGSIIRIAR